MSIYRSLLTVVQKFRRIQDKITGRRDKTRRWNDIMMNVFSVTTIIIRMELFKHSKEVLILYAAEMSILISSKSRQE